jgi:heat shock protein HtpX
MLFFILVGLSLDYVYLDAFTPHGPSVPIATLSALSFATVTTFTAYNFGANLILSSVGAERLDIEIPEHRELHNIVTEMALASGSGMPKLHVVFDPAPNAFATGRDEKSASICATTGLLALLNREETQGVVAHEMSHIRHQDTLLITLVSVLVAGIAILADWGQRGAYHARRSRGDGRKNPALFIPLLLLVAVSPIIAQLLAMAVSRQREYLADATAAQYTRNPVGLARALEKIRDADVPVNKATRGTAPLFFSDPLRRRLGDSESGLANLLTTHPPIGKRIRLLYQMAGLAR